MKKLNYKKVALVAVIVIALIAGTTYFLTNNSSKKQEPSTTATTKTTNKNKEINDFSDLSYYHKEYLSRYKAYQKKNPKLSIEDVVTQVNIGIDKEFFSKGAERLQNDPDSIHTIINKVYKLDDSWAPSDLVTVTNSGNLHQKEQQIRKEAADAFVKLRQHCKDNNITLYAHSGYRSTAYQKQIFNNMVKNYGVEYTDTVVSRPGHSEHTTGLCIDIALDNIEYDQSETHPKYNWFVSQLADYGFIVRYPKGKEKLTGYSYESWHIRYLGVDLAKKVTDSKLTYDEYYARNY